MFGMHEGRRGKGLFSFLFTIFRLLISLFIMGLLLLAVYSAYISFANSGGPDKSFSPVDLLKTDPKAVLTHAFSSEELIGIFTGLLSADPSQGLNKLSFSANKAKEVITSAELPGVSQPPTNTSNAPVDFKFAIISDTHNDSANFEKAIAQAKSNGAQFIVSPGDFTDVGTLEDLKKAKVVLDKGGLPYYVTAGDHDLWDSRDKGKVSSKNFTEVFGSPYQSFANKDVRIIIFYNADNYTGVDDTQMQWLVQELDRVNQNRPKLLFVLTGIPLFHPSSDHIMGKTTPSLKSQAKELITLFKEKQVNEIFAGDTHYFTRYNDPESGLPMTTSGAVTSVRNAQKPRFVIVEVLTDGSYNVRDMEIQ